MAAQNGRNMTIAVGDGGTPTETFEVVAGAREDSMTLENGEIDITNKDSGARRTLLDGGTQQINLTCSGVYVEGGMTTSDDLFNKARDGTITNYQVEYENGEKISGAFQVASYARTGAHDGAVTFEAELHSSGTYTYTAGT